MIIETAEGIPIRFSWPSESVIDIFPLMQLE